MKMLEDNSAQVGGIIMFFLGLFIIAFVYILLGGLEGYYVTKNNQLIANPPVSYSQDHKDAIGILFAYWWAIPIITVLFFIIYAVKNAIEEKTGQAY